MMKDKIYGVRDSYGNRPLCIGKIVPIDLKGSEYTYITAILLKIKTNYKDCSIQLHRKCKYSTGRRLGNI